MTYCQDYYKLLKTKITNNKKNMAVSKSNTNRMKLISTEAKRLYNGGKGEVKVWVKAIKKASENLKKQGKI